MKASCAWQGALPAMAGAAMILTWGVVAAAATVSVNPSTEYQTMDGFGASVAFMESYIVDLPEPKRTQALDLLFKDLGASILRLRINAFLERNNDNADPFDTNLSAYMWASNANARWVAQQALARGVLKQVWGACWSPPGWMKDNGSEINGGHILPSMYNEFAEFLYAYAAGMNQLYGIPINLVSMFNEPGFKVDYESTETTPAQYRDILKVVGQRFADEGIGYVKLMGPDAVNPTNNPPTGANAFLDSILADPVAKGYLKVGATHQYGESGGFNWAGFWSRCLSNSMPAWQTEMAKLGGATDAISGALEMNWWMWIAMTQGNCSSWHHWSYYWAQEAGAAQGLIAITGRPVSDFTVPKRYYTFKHFSRNVRPGCVRIGATSDNSNLYALAFKYPDQIVIVAFNRTLGSISTTFSVPGPIGSVIHTRTSGTEDYVRQPDIAVASGSFNLSVANESISTLVVPTAPARGCAMVIKNEAGAKLVAITKSGNLFVKGSLTEHGSPGQSAQAQFVLRNGSGTPILSVDSAGNLTLAGAVSSGQFPVAPGSPSEFVIKGASGDAAALVRSTGDLVLRGYAWPGVSF